MIHNAELYRLLDNIALLLGEKCEIVVHDFTKGFENTVVKIVNGHVSGRTLGACPTNLFFETYNTPEDVKEDTPLYFSTTADGRLIKSSTTFLYNDEGKVIGSVCINLDMSDLVAAQNELSTFIAYEKPKAQKKPKNEIYYRNVNELLEYYLQLAVQMIGKRPEDMNKQEKMQAIQFLDSKCVFQIAKVSIKLCHFFGISKFTLYNYLDEVREINRSIRPKESELSTD